jgi:hypothetical protein
MKVILNVQDDQELRNHIKEVIRQEITAIGREEAIELIRAELKRKVATGLVRSDTVIYNACVYVLSQELKTQKGSDLILDILKLVATEKIEQQLENRDWSKVVDDLAKEKIWGLIK